MGVLTVGKEVTMKKHQTEEKKLELRPYHNRYIYEIFRHPYIKSDQLTTLLYSGNSSADVRRRLYELEQAHYITFRYLPRATAFGKSPKLYYLDLAGYNVLKKEGRDLPKRFRRLEEEDKETLSNQLPHTVAVNDVIISAENLTKRFPQIHLSVFKHEREYKQEPPLSVTVQRRTSEGQVVLKNDKPLTQLMKFFPDALLDFHISQPERETPYKCRVFCEVDLGTEGEKKIRYKIRAYLEYVKSGKCLEELGIKLPSVAFINVEGGIHRRNVLMEMAEKELKLTRETNFWSEMFLFRSVERPLDCEELWLTDSWYMPFNDTPTILLSAGSR